MKLVPLVGGRKPHDNDEPSLTVVVPQLSLEQIFRDYCRGVLHPDLSVQGQYDPDGVDDDDFPHLQEVEDISEFVSSEPVPKVPAPSKKDQPKADTDSPEDNPPES